MITREYIEIELRDLLEEYANYSYKHQEYYTSKEEDDEIEQEIKSFLDLIVPE